MLISQPTGYCLKQTIPPFRSRKYKSEWRLRVSLNGFPAFLPEDVRKIKDSHAITLAKRIERVHVPVENIERGVMSSCVRPSIQGRTDPVVLLHGFDSSCLEWRYAYPLLEDAGLEIWAIDILGWGFSDIAEGFQSCDPVSKRKHLYQLWRTYIKRPMVLVGPSLGAAVAIDFAVHHSEAVSKLVLIDASVYAEGTGKMATLPKTVAYAGVAILKSAPLRFYVNRLLYYNLPWNASREWTSIGRLHCLLPWWEDATVNFMISGGYKVSSLISQVKQKTLIIWGENDKIISYKLAVRLHCDLPNAILRRIPDCGHIPHLEKPRTVANLILKFAKEGFC